jgi:hypothetical protein
MPAISSIAVILLVIAPYTSVQIFIILKSHIENQTSNFSRCTSAYLLSQAVRSNCHSHRKDSGHGDWNSSNQKHQQIVNSRSVSPVLDSVHDDKLHGHSHSN